MNSVFNEQFKLLRKEKEDGKNQLRKIGKKLLPNFQKLSCEEKKQNCIWELYFFSIKNFWDYYEFIIQKVTKGEEGHIQYYIGNVRTLIEIYINLVFLFKEPDNVKVASFAGHQLAFLADISDDNYKDRNSKLEIQYNGILNQLKDILDSENIFFPETINEFKKSRKGVPIYEPKMENILKKGSIYYHYLKEVSTHTHSVYKSKEEQETFWLYYSFCSNYIHRQFINQTQYENLDRNEKFWLIPILHLLGFSMIELTGLILNDSAGPKIFEYGLELNSGISKNFFDLWEEKSIRKQNPYF